MTRTSEGKADDQQRPALYFCSDRPGGEGSIDLWMTTRNSPDSRWNEPTNLGPIINTSGIEFGPCVSSDQLTLYFNSNREGGFGGGDLWMSQRESLNSAWGTPVNLGPGVNTATNETNLFVSDDELTILFAGDMGGHILWMATRPALDAPFANRRPLELPFEPKKGTEGPTVFNTSNNGRVLVFTSNFTGSKSWDLWWSQRVPR